MLETMNPFNETGRAEEAKEAGETKQAFPARHQTENPKEAQTGNLEKLCRCGRFEDEDPSEVGVLAHSLMPQWGGG